MSDEPDTQTTAAAIENGRPDDFEPVAPGAGDGWQTDTRGRSYVPKPGGGAVYRRGEETVEQAIARAAQAKDKRPRSKGSKSKRPPMPPAPKKVDLKELEQAIAEGLMAPAMVCATLGDEWSANHFTKQGPYLARNLVMASEHNPWLRRKLEDAASGQDAAMKLISLVGVAGALFGYAVPPIVWWLNLPVPEKAREMFGIPPERDRPQSPFKRAPDAPGAESAESPQAA